MAAVHPPPSVNPREPARPLAATGTGQTPVPGPKHHVRFGATGLTISRLVLGTMGGGLATAGRTEEIIGRWVKGRRGRVIIATKAVGKVGPSAWDQGSSRKHLLDAIDASLRRLGTEYVDLYQLHSDDLRTPLDETVDALDTIVRSGKARYVGVSNFLAYRLARLIGHAETRRLARVV